MKPLAKMITIGDKYRPGMEMTDEKTAAEYFELCVQHTMSFDKTREEAIAVEKANFGYYAGYYDNETRHRVERLFLCAHPIFGAIAKVGAPTAEEAMQAGLKMAARATAAKPAG